jgi:hypothetical protein
LIDGEGRIIFPANIGDRAQHPQAPRLPSRRGPFNRACRQHHTESVARQ